MVHFVGAGPGAPDLITLRGAELLEKADQVIYAGSLVNPALLEYAKPGCLVYNSAEMTLEEVIEVMKEAQAKAEYSNMTPIAPCIEDASVVTPNGQYVGMMNNAYGNFGTPVYQNIN